MKIMMKHIGMMCGCLSLMACATAKPAVQGATPEFGQSVKANITAQAIKPSAEQKANTHIPANPARTALARKNYRENTVPEPQRSQTTDVN